MSAVAGVKKVKKVTKTTSKKVDGGETVSETTTTMSRETSSGTLANGSTNGSKETSGSLGREENEQQLVLRKQESRDIEFEAMFCHQCDDSLAGHRYVLREDFPYCIKCYENVFANNCDECGKIIGIDSKDLSSRRSTGTSHVSFVTSAVAVWWTSSLVPRLIESTAGLATTPSLHPDVTPVETSSRRV